MQPDLWVLTGDEAALADGTSPAAQGDLIVRRTSHGAEVGELVDGGAPRVAWWGEIDASLLPDGGELLPTGDGSSPLQRIDGPPELRTAIDGIESAHRHRGG